MRRLAALAALCCLAASSSPIDLLAGRYDRHFRNQLYDGQKYSSDDVVEIVPVDPDHAYIRVHLERENGHKCALSGVAAMVDTGLVYSDTSRPSLSPDRCRLTIRHVGDALQLDDGYSCHDYCGANDTLTDVLLPWRSRRPIRYMAALKTSPQYIAALKNQAAR